MYVAANYILVHSRKLRSKYAYKCIYMCCFGELHYTINTLISIR